jgi:hypothetical protein
VLLKFAGVRPDLERGRYSWPGRTLCIRPRPGELGLNLAAEIHFAVTVSYLSCRWAGLVFVDYSDVALLLAAWR